MSGAQEPTGLQPAATARERQEAMDGSPAIVVRTLIDLSARGKFAGLTFSPEAQPKQPVIKIMFQCGPIGEVGINGCAIEDVIDVLIERLEGFQRGPFRCAENAAAILSLEDAKACLLERTARRQAQGVEGRNLPHRSDEAAAVPPAADPVPTPSLADKVRQAGERIIERLKGE